MELFLHVNGKDFQADVDEQEEMMFDLAAGHVEKDEFFDWVRSHVTDAT